MEYAFITDKNDFFQALKIPTQKMNYLLYNKHQMGPENMYSTFSISKKSGGERIIHAPSDELKSVQKKLAKLLENHYYESIRNNKNKDTFLQGFLQNRGIITNAKVHRNKKHILNIDLEDFFHTIHFGRVKGFFEKDKTFKVPSEVALIIARLTCYKGALPQGAPTSPIISNLIGKIMDFRLIKLCKKYKLSYTRYADDLTFSTNDNSFLKLADRLIIEIKNEVRKSGFKVNEKKTRVQNYRLRQDVTNITVNKKLNVSKTYFKNTRAMAHHLYKHQEYFIDDEIGTLEQLEGRFAFINQIDKYNNKLSRAETYEKKSLEQQKYLVTLFWTKNLTPQFFKYLNSREKEYQNFLFYKYFYANAKPLIVTEGKTDIRYLKAALKNLYKEYPDLIEKNDNGFKFKISFLNRFSNKPKKITKLHYFLNIVSDGADAMKNIYNYYVDKDPSYPNFVEYFKNVGKVPPSNPVLLLFDNELNNNNKPLYNFCNFVKLKKNQKSELSSKYKTCLTANLYLLTHQLLHNCSENELEDLFTSNTLAKTINNKVFCKKDKFDNTKYYGKEIFSKYISSNYKTINFDNFKPVLDNIVEALKEYENKL
ncbi:RNA-dependent DNA polymerase [Staphylococcus sp. HMSC10C03]|uniref:retron Ec67 family RNA-directed DNA polymerase/endonuclease n=1 Tax=Staphylococcus sp. HMSC10C03 TaxID=1581078 RepID=UPI0008A5CBF8|nr:retron Ec67 family RNA-directed DNA polymerase/endonuclease [Staphylococcus sp. HMSC10C03]OFU79063.1 RNA-dependent DNA polymerase [Staphylococcus sp. HMSC10C03]